MSLSPVIGTEVPETANGVVIPISSENSPHGPVSVKCGGSREPCSGEASEDGSFCHIENHVGGENRVYDGDGYLDTEMDNTVRPASLSLHTAPEMEPSLPVAACTADSESGSKDTVNPSALSVLEPPDAALVWSQSKYSSPRDTTDRQQTVDEHNDSREEEEEEDGEKEKQDEEEDEKKWRNELAEGRKEVEVSGLDLA